MQIWKFGGSSVSKPERIHHISEIVSGAETPPRAIVFSAFGGVTDELLELLRLACTYGEDYKTRLQSLRDRHLTVLAELTDPSTQEEALPGINELLDELADLLKGVSLTKDVTNRTRDQILSFGERLSTLIIHWSFRERGIECDFLDAREIIVTDESYGSAYVDKPESYERIRGYFAENEKLQCVTGFIASSSNGFTTTLGRGGSDYTGAILAAALDAERLEIWTDVDGVLTADPRKVPSAQLVSKVSYLEAMELSHFGAKVLYPPTIQPVREKGIPLVVRNTFKPGCTGTFISQDADESPIAVTALSSITPVCLLTLQGSGLVGVPGSSRRMFGALATRDVNVVLISQASSELSICIAILEKDRIEAEEAVNKEFELEIAAGRVEPARVETDCSILSVVGDRMKQTPGVAAAVFSALAKNLINILAIAQGSTEENISFVIRESDEKMALQAIHRNCFERHQQGSVFLLGPGQVGSAFLRILEKQLEFVRRTRALDLKLVGAASSSRVLTSAEGLQAAGLKDELKSGSQYGSTDELLERITSLHAPNLVVVDCTAADGLSELYESLLQKRIPVIGANKKVQTGSTERYERLKNVSEQLRVPWKYETAVGAALPILGTLEQLILSGDSVHRIEAVLSGSLSFIFNELAEGRDFSQVVLEAKERGFLEPDPRDDLNGIDFARKLLILARLLGYSLKLSDIEIQPLLPSEVFEIDSSEEFLQALPAHDQSFRERASQTEGRLCCLGTFEKGKGKISLQTVPAGSPFCGLRSTDNLIALYTDRYKERPLVIQGAGAGPEVTASGVFSELIEVLKMERESV